MAFIKRMVGFAFLVLALTLVLLSQQINVQGQETATAPLTNTPHNNQPTEGAPATNTKAVINATTLTSTKTPLSTKTLTSTRTPTKTKTATNTKVPTNTRTPTPTRTPTRTPSPFPTMAILGTYETPVEPPVTAIPPAAPTPVASGDDIVTILLLGSDTITPDAVARTDVVILVAIDRTTNTVTMLHLPRDLMVYAPNYTMAKLNTIMNYGNVKYGPGGGAKLIKDTILYNFGIKVNFYARVDFVNFERLIIKLGGLDVSVDCAIMGHRLKSPELDVTKADNYELYTMPVGYRHLDAYMALWYVRSRGSSSDLDRGRRQLDVLRAMWRQARNAGLFAQITTLWPEAQKIVETDMTLQDVLGLAPVGLAVDPTNIQRINVGMDTHFTTWYTGDTGSYALLPKPDAWKTTIQNFLLPPTANRLGGESPTVEVGAALPLKGYDQVAADRLSWEGFSAKVIGTEGVINRDVTVIYDYTGSAKPNSLASMMKILRVTKAAVISKPDPNRTVDFRVEMGKDYGQCLFALPKEFQDLPITPTAKP